MVPLAQEIRLMPRLLALLLLLAFTVTAHAGKYNQTHNIGDKAPTWTKLPGVDGNEHSSDELKDWDVVVLFFTCNSCEYAIDYEDRIIAIAKKYSGADSRVAFVGVNVNRIGEDRLPKMKERAEKRGFPFVYLFDETQQIAKDFDATTTPEFYVLDRERRIAYMGSLDDNSDAKKATINYVQQAIDALLDGKKPKTTETVPIGCLVRYERTRRTKK
jgi:peroxiredoxin